MQKELEKYGIQMPAFSKIGGILANELSVDEAAGMANNNSHNIFFLSMYWFYPTLVVW